MRKFLISGAVAITAACGLAISAPAPDAQALWCPGAVNMGSVHIPIAISVLVVEFCDWAPPVPGVDSHRHCEYGGFIGYGERCDWRNNANIIVPPPPGYA